MTNKQAYKLLMNLIAKEKRHKRQFYLMYREGFLAEKNGHDRYLELLELEKILKRELSEWTQASMF